jgi:hypothetical protein
MDSFHAKAPCHQAESKLFTLPSEKLGSETSQTSYSGYNDQVPSAFNTFAKTR